MKKSGGAVEIMLDRPESSDLVPLWKVDLIEIWVLTMTLSQSSLLSMLLFMELLGFVLYDFPSKSFNGVLGRERDRERVFLDEIFDGDR